MTDTSIARSFWHNANNSNNSSNAGSCGATYPESKARDVAHENFLDLKHIHDERDAGFFIKNGVKAGAARQLVSNIAH